MLAELYRSHIQNISQRHMSIKNNSMRYLQVITITCFISLVAGCDGDLLAKYENWITQIENMDSDIWYPMFWVEQQSGFEPTRWNKTVLVFGYGQMNYETCLTIKDAFEKSDRVAYRCSQVK